MYRKVTKICFFLCIRICVLCEGDISHKGVRMVLGRKVKKKLDVTVFCGLLKGHSSQRYSMAVV